MHIVETLNKEQFQVLKALGVFTSLVKLPKEFEFEHIPLFEKYRMAVALREKYKLMYEQEYKSSIQRVQYIGNNAKRTLTELLIINGKYEQAANTVYELQKQLKDLVSEYYIIGKTPTTPEEEWSL